MNIAEKLALSERSGYLSLIDEGLFLRIYNQSAYLVNELHQQELTLSCNVIKKLNNKPIIYCAFPKSSLSQRFKHVVATPWGFEIQGEFDLTDYPNWFNWAFDLASQRLMKRNEAKHQNNRYQPSIVHNSTHTAANIANFDNVHLIASNDIKRTYLDDKQIAFIKNWQRGLYPSEVVEGFMESLKQQLVAIGD